MRQRTIPIFLVVLCLAALLLRLYFSFSVPNFTYDSYFHIRQVESIHNTGFPLINDPLAKDNSPIVFSFLYDYVLAFFSFFIPLVYLFKIIPNLFLTLAIIPVFFIAKEMVRNEFLALIGAGFFAFVPFIIEKTVFSISSLSLFLLLLLCLFYAFIKMKEKVYFQLAIFLLFAVSFLSPLSLILIPIFWFHYLILKIERIPEREKEQELIIFATFLIILAQIIVYKKAILLHGLGVFSGNLPTIIMNSYFWNTDILGVIYAVGIIPFLLGISAVYMFSFSEKERVASLLISLVTVIGFFLLLHAIPIVTGIILLSVGMCILSVTSLESLFIYFKKTTFSSYTIPLFGIIILFFILTSIFPSIHSTRGEQIVSSDEIIVLNWIRENVQSHEKILVHPRDGFLMQTVGLHKPVIDENYLLVKDSDVLYQNVISAFTTKFETEATDIFDRYNITYLYISPNVFREFGIKEPDYLNDERCFQKEFVNNRSVYRIKCSLKQI